MKHEPEQDMEKYLSEFQPRAVRPLETEGTTKHRVAYEVARFDWQRLAAAAVLLVALGTSVWYAQVREPATQTADRQQVQTERAPQKDLSNLQLTRLALTDQQRFSEVIGEQSRRVLPNLNGERSTLRVLAQE